MSRVDVSKVFGTALVGPANASVSVPKVVMYVLLEPNGGDDTGGNANRQGHVYVQMVRN